jgi:Mg2+-importing ATPase
MIAAEELARKRDAEIFRTLKSSGGGLSHAEAVRRLKQYGRNEFAERKRLRPLFIFFSKFKSPLLLLLIAAAIISGALGSRFEAGIILVIVFVSALIDFINTYRSARAAEALQEKVTITAAVSRGGAFEERNMREIVPGDVIALGAGDLVPADSVLLEAKDFFVNESVLTGESLPVEKAVERPGGRAIYLGTSVVSGKGLAVVAVTGFATKVGGLAGKLARPEEPSEFERNLKDFSLFIFRITLFLVLAMILLNTIFLHRDLLQIFLFAVAIAVGLTPELLPLIVTSNLAKGAIAMSKGGVIVKKLAAIHNFGSVDILCTDKTGTLTEDRIVLMKSVDASGKESEAPFFWGYVSSAHQTGLASVLDKAIEAHKKLDVSAWEKVDEIPFDHERRFGSVVVKGREKTILVTKGAPEGILKRMAKIPLALRAKIDVEYEKLSVEGFRVLAVATREVPFRRTPYTKSDEKDLIFVGFLAFLDPPKKTAKATLQRMAAHHVGIKIITGDNFLVTRHIAGEIGFAIKGMITGNEIAKLDEHRLRTKVEAANVFVRTTPEEKERIIWALRKNGHVVAYLGDGVNDVLALKEADVGISVQNAVDIAKETADLILLRRGLGEIIEGIIEGRRTFANTFKYLMMALSSNFGNMFSMPIASIFLPFFPMTAPQILLNNFLYDSSQVAIPFDRVDADFLARPKKFNLDFMKKFMILFGPLSSCFDFVTFGVLFWVLGATGGTFQTGWFLESIATQTLVVMVIRSRAAFSKSRPAWELILFSVVAVAAGWLVPYSHLGPPLGFVRFGPFGLSLIALIVVAYLFAVEIAKKYFYRKYGDLIER